MEMYYLYCHSREIVGKTMNVDAAKRAFQRMCQKYPEDMIEWYVKRNGRLGLIGGQSGIETLL